MTDEDVRTCWPDRFEWDDGEPYAKLDSDMTGNADWVDFQPELMVAIVDTSEGETHLVALFNAADWFLSKLGAMP